MGDFDKNKTPDAGAEKKKLLMVGVLGAVLLGVLGFHFMKGGGPQVAAASTLNDVGLPTGIATMEETPLQAQAALADDPTASLLRGTSTARDPLLEKTPHNPFIMSMEWRTELVHPTEVHVVNHQPVYVPQVIPQAVNVEKYKLSGILHQSNTLCAIINGQVVSAGMVVDDAKVLEITPQRVTLQRVDSPTGPKSFLTIDPKL
jgi:hypothetical protein